MKNNGKDRRSVRTVKRRIAAAEKSAVARKAKKAVEAKLLAEAAHGGACEAGQLNEDKAAKGPWATNNNVSDVVVEDDHDDQQQGHQPPSPHYARQVGECGLNG